MTRRLRIDLEQLNATIAKYDQSTSEFENIIKTLDISVDALRSSGWKSGASDAYFKNFDETWKKNMEMHISIINHLTDCLREAKREYESIYNSIPTLKNQL